MCYGANCCWEESWSGECRKPHRYPCPMDEDAEEMSEEELEELRYGREDYEAARYVERREEGLTCWNDSAQS